MTKIPIAITLIGTAFLCATAQAKNLIVNGGFESPQVPMAQDCTSLQAGNGSLTGWTIIDSAQQASTGGITVINHWINVPKNQEPSIATLPSEGDQFLQLQNHITKSSGMISQSFNTVVGQQYALQFDYTALDFTSRPIILKYSVGIDEQTIELVSQAYQQIPWATHTLEFEAIASVTTLSFDGQFIGGFWGPSIDNVRVSVPEPQTCAWLGGLLALTCAATRRRKST
jgi:hypothetical protein